MIDLENIIYPIKLKIITSIVLVLITISLIYLVRKLQKFLSNYITPILIDLSSSIFIVFLVLSSTILITDIWGQTNNLLSQLGILTLDDKFSKVIVTIVIVVSIQVFLNVISRLLKDLSQKNDAITQHQKEVSYRATQLILLSIGLISILGI